MSVFLGFKLFSCSDQLEAYKCLKCTFTTNQKALKFKHNCDTVESGVMFKNCRRCKTGNWFYAWCVFHSTRCVFDKIHKKHVPLHLQQWYECDQCLNKVAIKQDPQTVMLSSFVKLFQCDQCSFTTRVKSYLKTHKDINHAPDHLLTVFDCDQCTFKTQHKVHLKLHQRKEHNKWLDCDYCYYKSNNKTNLYKHIIAQHNLPAKQKWLYCDQCEYKSMNKSNLNRHRRAIHNYRFTKMI